MSDKSAVVAVTLLTNDDDACTDTAIRHWEGNWRLEWVRDRWLLAEADLSKVSGRELVNRRQNCPEFAARELIYAYYRSLARVEFDEHAGLEWRRAWSRLAPQVRAGFGGFQRWRAKTDTDIASVSTRLTRWDSSSAAVAVTVDTGHFDACGNYIRYGREGDWRLGRVGRVWQITRIAWSKVAPVRFGKPVGKCRGGQVLSASARALRGVVSDYYLALRRAVARRNAAGDGAYSENADRDWERAWSRLSPRARARLGGFKRWRDQAVRDGDVWLSARPVAVSRNSGVVVVGLRAEAERSSNDVVVSCWKGRWRVERTDGEWLLADVDMSKVARPDPDGHCRNPGGVP